ncbi:MAG TPA: ABC transporter substrate-binding protein [Oscillatoriaceae cyanobacterium]
MRLRLLALLFVALAWLGLSSLAMAAPTAHAAPHASRHLYVGVYLNDVSNFDLKEGQFNADLFLWCKWRGASATPQLDLSNCIVNNQNLLATESDGDWHSARWRVQGTFRGTFPLQMFPFDRQKLTIDVELPADSPDTIAPDLVESGMAHHFSITGWIYEPYFKAGVAAHDYSSDLGSITDEGQPRKPGAVSFVLDLSRPIASYAIKFLIPLAIIVTMAVLALFVQSEEVEVRSAMVVTALLSCVAFHVSQSDSLPDVPYLVVADKFFLWSYALILVTLVVVVAANHFHKEHPERVKRVDRGVAIGVFVFMALGIGSTLWNVSHPAEAAIAAVAPPKPYVSTRNQLVADVLMLPNLDVYDLRAGLLRRGLYTIGAHGEKIPHLVRVVPDFTNEYVRFTPDGGMVVRWPLRPGLRWSDGSAITPEDLAFSVRMTENPDVRNIHIEPGGVVDVSFDGREEQNLEAFDVYPRAALEALYEKKGLDAVTERIKKDPPPGDGPYVLEYFTAHKEAVFRRNPYFAGRTPAIEHLIVKQDKRFPKPEFLAHQVDLLPDLSIKTTTRLEGTPGVATDEGPSNELYLLQPDLSVPALAREDVRHALLMALDRGRIAHILAGRYGIPADSYRLPAGPLLQRYAYDPGRAKAILSKAGVLPLRLTFSCEKVPTGNAYAAACDEIRAELAAVGVETQPVYINGRFNHLYGSGRHGGLLFGERVQSDYTSKFWNFPTQNGFYDVNHPHGLYTSEVMTLYTRFQSTLYPERRALLADRLEQIWSERLPVLPVCYGGQGSACEGDLAGWNPLPDHNFWWNAEDWRFAKSVKP